MIGLIICIIITLFIAIITSNEFWQGLFVFVGVGFIILGVYGVICMSVFLHTDSIYTVTAKYEQKQYNISGLENKTSQEFELNGTYRKTFLLGYGSISAETDTEMNYYYFKENEYGKILESMACKDVYIREVEDGENCLIYVVEEREFKGYPVLSKIFLGVNKENRKIGQVVERILQVPVGTVQIEYNVDV